MFITLTEQVLNSLSPAGKVEFEKKYPKGIGIDELLALDNINKDIIFWIEQNYKNVLTAEQKEKLHQALKIVNSKEITYSESIEDSSYITSSRFISDSRTVLNSIMVRDSTDVYHSNNITYSSLVIHCSVADRSKCIINSQKIFGSTAIYGSQNVQDSEYLVNCEEMDHCAYCRACRGLTDCLFCFCKDQGRNLVFNQEVDPSTIQFLIKVMPSLDNPKTIQKIYDAMSEAVDKGTIFQFSTVIPPENMVWFQTLPNYDQQIISAVLKGASIKFDFL